jgi:hypothetical protein
MIVTATTMTTMRERWREPTAVTTWQDVDDTKPSRITTFVGVIQQNILFIKQIKLI